MRTWASGCSTKTFLFKKKCRVTALRQSKLFASVRRRHPSSHAPPSWARVICCVARVWRYC